MIGIRTSSLLLTVLLPLQNFVQSGDGALERGHPDEAYYSVDDFRSVEKIDAHVHIRAPIDTAFIAQAEEDRFNFLTVNVYSSSSPPVEEQEEIALRFIKSFPGRLAWVTTFSLEHFNDEGWQEATIAYLKSSLSKGAIAVKVWKNVGFFLKDANGQLVMIDHPRFDPILDFLAKNNIPLIGHLGEHRNSWLPLEKMTVRGNRDYARAHPEEHMYLHPERPSYESYIQARDRMLDKHPDLRFIGAHLGSLEWSVDELARRLDKYPNMAVDMAERISHLQYQALTDRKRVRDFCIKYQDRLLYATDLRNSGMDIVNSGIKDPAGLRKHAHEVWLRHWRFFTTGDKMRVPKVDGEFTGLKLPREVVDKIYSKNAEKWYPGILNGKHE